MPKALCWIGIAVAIIVLIFFILDLALRFPFNRFSVFVDVAFIVSALILGYLSWATLREQD